MKRKLSIPFTLLMILLLAAAVTGCGQPAGEEAAANVQEAAEEAVEEVAEEGAGEEAETAAGTTEAVIGFTASQTGNLTVESTNQINGLNLCMAQIEEAGGIPGGRHQGDL